MRKIMDLKLRWAVALYLLLVLLTTGAGMGVPFFNILLGLPVGWWLVQRLDVPGVGVRTLMGKLLGWAAATAGVSVLAMLVIWMQAILMLFDPAADLANFGIPLILFEPKASFIGWLVLMIVISPFLQMLMTLLGAQLTLWLKKPALVVE
ncbi:hypothetical protein KQH50_02505 [bacterium]|nr:hypothetical protein [bacterium]